MNVITYFAIEKVELKAILDSKKEEKLEARCQQSAMADFV